MPIEIKIIAQDKHELHELLDAINASARAQNTPGLMPVRPAVMTDASGQAMARVYPMAGAEPDDFTDVERTDADALDDAPTDTTPGEAAPAPTPRRGRPVGAKSKPKAAGTSASDLSILSQSQHEQFSNETAPPSAGAPTPRAGAPTPSAGADADADASMEPAAARGAAIALLTEVYNAGATGAQLVRELPAKYGVAKFHDIMDERVHEFLADARTAYANVIGAGK